MPLRMQDHDVKDSFIGILLWHGAVPGCTLVLTQLTKQEKD
jgi:hypothetical protein